MVDNKKFKPDNYLTETKVSSKPNKNKKGEITSHSYSTVIPKPVLNKLGLYHGQKLYWDINKDNTITITPELPETQSIEAGVDILNDMLIKGNTTTYLKAYSNINTFLNAKDKENNTKVTNIVNVYGNLRVDSEKENFTKVVTYLLDYPLPAEHHNILQQVYDEITKTD